eukprot:7212121-Pyramimonas_sp.AAC.1
MELINLLCSPGKEGMPREVPSIQPRHRFDVRPPPRSPCSSRPTLRTASSDRRRSGFKLPSSSTRSRIALSDVNGQRPPPCERSSRRLKTFTKLSLVSLLVSTPLVA